MIPKPRQEACDHTRSQTGTDGIGRHRGITAAVLVCVWLLSLLYMAFYLKRGWVPHDEGAYAQSAERVLEGELPHRDFIDSYTGGLSFLNAGIFRIFGTDLASLRIPLFLLFAFWVPCLFYIASRLTPPLTAGAVTLLAVAWSVPNYPAAAPSWYNLFFAIFGVAALLRHMDVGSRRWVFIAGLCAGFSTIMKITGAYFVCATILYFIFAERSLPNLNSTSIRKSTWFYKGCILAGLAVFLAFLAKLIHKVQGVDGLIYFVIPIALLVSLLVYREFVESRGINLFASLGSKIVLYLAGMAPPVIIFLVPYWLSHSTTALLHDLFAGSAQQLQFAATKPPSSLLMLPLLPILLILIIATYTHGQGRLLYRVFLVCYLVAILKLSSTNQLAYSQGWCSLAFAVPIITFAGVMTVGVPTLASRLSVLRQKQVMLLISASALVSLVQFPFSGPIYFCYVAPLVILAAAAVFVSLDIFPRFPIGCLLVFYLLFAITCVTPGSNLNKFVPHATNVKLERLNIVRSGGLLVNPSEARLYEQLIAKIRLHALGNYIYAAPDCPEIYFLSGLQNPTRAIFDFRDERSGPSERTLLTLKSHDVTVIAINNEPEFSMPLEADLKEALAKLYPQFEDIDHFQVRWKGPDSRDNP
jgi:hypothetical protein